MRISGWTCIEDNRKKTDEEILMMWEYKNGDTIIVYTPKNDYLIEYEDSKTFEITKSIRIKSLRKALETARNLMNEIAMENKKIYTKRFNPVTISFTEKELIQSKQIAKRKKYKQISEQANILVERYLRLNKLQENNVDLLKLHKIIENMLIQSNYVI